MSISNIRIRFSHQIFASDIHIKFSHKISLSDILIRFRGCCCQTQHLSGKAPKVMLSHVLLQWNHMTEDDVHSSQDLLAQILQMHAYIFCPWVWSLRMHAQSDFICGGTCEHVKNGML